MIKAVLENIMAPHLSTPHSEDALGKVYLELVDLLFMFRLPLIIMTSSVGAFGWVIHNQTGTSVSLVLTYAAVSIGLLRLLHMELFRRRKKRQFFTLAEGKRWERQYGAGSVLFGLLLGLLCAEAIRSADPRVDTLGYVLCLGFGCGLVSRSGFRARMTSATLVALMIPVLLAIIPRLSEADPAVMQLNGVIVLFLGAFVLGGIATSLQAQRVIVELLVTRCKYHSVAHADALTGAANRLLLSERFATAAASGRAANLALHCLDLDRFKPVNDRYGHATGDALLVAVTGRISRLLGPEDTLARVGGDEFVILQSEVSARQAAAFAERVVSALAEPFELDGIMIEIGASLGTTIAAEGSTLETLRGEADRALYFAKESGRNRCEMHLKAA
ncbi:GGDEF domain-containing protein [Novosphingobium sp. RD2P27]|uniref:GGDEF domain-containing protein n=1 Tax=Novosphingobium kalidii TaxID=3230299 RepID=A0ABV2CY42_9SPHN